MTFPILGGNGAVAGYSIDNSLRFNDDDSPRLTRTHSSEGNKKIWSYSTWFKRGNLKSSGTVNLISAGASSGTNGTGIQINNDSIRIIHDAGTPFFTFQSSRVLRDVASYYHLLVVCDTTDATAGDRIKFYLNGNDITSDFSYTNGSAPSQNSDLFINDDVIHTIGARSFHNDLEFDGYMAETHLIDGTIKSPTDFGEFDEDSGIWKPKEYTGTYGTNGFYLDFSNSGTLGEDFSGNDNDFTATNLASTDQTTDTPTNNFVTMNPLSKDNFTFSQGNLQTDCTASNQGTALSTVALTTGKWYVEGYINSGHGVGAFGLADAEVNANSRQGGFTEFTGDILYRVDGSAPDTGTNWSAGGIIALAVDIDNKTYTLKYNNTALRTDESYTSTAELFIYTQDTSASYATGFIFNFGQDSSFAGNKTRQNNSDGNGFGDFYYSPPSGYLALCTQNLATALSPTIDDGSQYFNTVLYTGANPNAAQSITGVGFQPDWIWIKSRVTGYGHCLVDSNRGATGRLQSDTTGAEAVSSTYLSSIDSDGFSLGTDYGQNAPNEPYVAWNWKAGGTAPTQTYTVKVVSDSGNKYRFDDFGTSAVTLDLQEGGTYTFDQSDSSNSGHPLRFSTTSDGTHGSGSEYTTGVTTTGTPGSSGAKTVITVAASAPTLYYYCSSHSGMGGQANTNTTHGSSNFAGSIQSTVQANTTAGFSIVTYTGTGANATIGHGLGVAPKMIICKQRNNTSAHDWIVYHESIGNTDVLQLNQTYAKGTYSVVWNNTSPTSSVFSVGTAGSVNESGKNQLAYCFAEIEGYSKFGSYTGNGSSDGTFVYTGFRPAFVIIKRTDSANSWTIRDSKRSTFNVMQKSLFADLANAEADSSNYNFDFLSNGFKQKNSNGIDNASGGTYIYMAFAENPFVDSNGIPVTAR